MLPHFDYCSLVWDCMSGYLNGKLQTLQNRAARVITKSPFDTSSNLLQAILKWEKLSLRRKKQKALIMYKTLNELAPEYLQCLFTQSHVNDYNLRNLEGKLSLRKPNTNYLKRSFVIAGHGEQFHTVSGSHCGRLFGERQAWRAHNLSKFNMATA